MSSFRLRRWHRALLLFSIIFVLSVLIQFTVGWYQRRAATQDRLNHWAQQIEKDLLYAKRWDLKRYRQAVSDATHYYIFDSGGRIIDLEGFVPELGIRVDVKDAVPGMHTPVISETNESWRLLVSRLNDGLLLLGVTPPDEITNVDKRLTETAKKFGASLNDALRVNSSDVNANIHYAVVRNDGTIEDAAGGIPLKAISTPNIVQNKLTEVTGNKGSTYGILALPVRDSSGHEVGSLMVFDELSPKPWRSLQNWLINILSSALLALVGTLISIPYLGNEFRPEKLLQVALLSGESATTEFKEALRWDKWPDQQQKEETSAGAKKRTADAEPIAIKNVAAFLNNETGGTLFIGIRDNKQIVGLEGDYESLGRRESLEKDRDRFLVHLGNLLSARIGQDLTHLCIKAKIIEHQGKDVCVIHMEPSPTPIYISEGNNKIFYARLGVSTVSLNIEDAVTYIDRRWAKTIWHRLWNAVRMLRT